MSGSAHGRRSANRVRGNAVGREDLLLPVPAEILDQKTEAPSILWVGFGDGALEAVGDGGKVGRARSRLPSTACARS